MFNGIAIWPPVQPMGFILMGISHTLSITDVSLVCWFHLKLFTALFANIGWTADIKICGLPSGRNSPAVRSEIREQKTKIKNKIPLVFLTILVLLSKIKKLALCKSTCFRFSSDARAPGRILFRLTQGVLSWLTIDSAS